jgi:hypothetical protein
MESNSKPNMIHISESCHDLVVSKASLMREFRMVPRGYEPFSPMLKPPIRIVVRVGIHI